MSELEALQKAVSAAGGQTALARKISEKLGVNVKQGHVWHWLNKSHKAPPDKVIVIEGITGIPRHELRPDVYPPPMEAA